MDSVADFFLRAKHWQIFALAWGIYGAAQVTLIAVAPPGSLYGVVLVDWVIPLFADQAGPQTRHNSIPRCSRLPNAVLAHSFAIVFDCQ